MENFKRVNKERFEKEIKSFKDMKKDEISKIEDYDEKRDQKLWDFYYAIVDNDIKAIKEFLKEGFSPNEELSFPSENTVFFESLPHVSLEALEILYNTGAQVVEYDSEGNVFYTAFEELIALDRPEIIEKLIDLGADWKVKNSGCSMLYYASSSASSLKVFLEKTDLDVNEEAEDGTTPIFMAAIHHDRDAIKMLLEHGALINKQDKNGLTALHHILKSDYVENKSKRIEAIRLLLEHGADPNIKSNEGKTPLDYAIEKRFLDEADFLRNEGAKLGKEI
ncbi:MAG: ankyrin repeat domain-containing protein [Candidatus Micrarchaeia archaeon]